MVYEEYMKIAINMVKEGIKYGEQPYGAVLVADGQIIHKAHNEVLSSKDLFNHAEIVVLKQYLNSKRERPKELILFSTCEPCLNCLGVAVKLGVNKIVFGSSIEEAIKYNSGDIPIKIKDFQTQFNIVIVEGILEQECNEILKEFHETKNLYKDIIVKSVGTHEERFWMKRALEIGRQGMLEKHELPIGIVVVAGDRILSESCTMTYTLNSPITHGDFMALFNAQREVYSCEKPLVLYSTLEPHILGFGACIKSKVDKVVYGMEAIPDGGSCYIPHMVNVKEWIPRVVGGVYEHEQYELMKEFIATHDEKRVGFTYAKSIVSAYEKQYNT